MDMVASPIEKYENGASSVPIRRARNHIGYQRKRQEQSAGRACYRSLHASADVRAPTILWLRALFDWLAVAEEWPDSAQALRVSWRGSAPDCKGLGAFGVRLDGEAEVLDGLVRLTEPQQVLGGCGANGFDSAP